LWVVTGVSLLLVVLNARSARSQDEPTSRTAVIEEAEAERAKDLHPFRPNKVEATVNRVMDAALTGETHWHPFWTSAYSGGGFTLGAGYRSFVSGYNTVDLRGSYTFSGYKRLEAEFVAPRMFDRRAMLAAVGGWREATQVGFYGLGMATSSDDRVNYAFTQPYASATLQVRPARGALFVTGALEVSEWNQQSSDADDHPSVEQVYPPGTLPGLGASPAYIHTQGSVGVDTRPGADEVIFLDYARRGGAYGITAHDYTDTAHQFGFQQVDYDAIQHIPLLRETWIVSLHGRVETTYTKTDEVVPFFMLPSLGSGSNLRAYPSWRFRDRNSVLAQAEWRAMVNRFFETALFFDAGKVTAHRSDIDLSQLRTDYGLGFRFHGPTATPLRVDFAYGSEGFSMVFAASSVF